MPPAELPENSERFGLFFSVISLSSLVAMARLDSFLSLFHHMIWILGDKCQELGTQTHQATDN